MKRVLLSLIFICVFSAGTFTQTITLDVCGEVYDMQSMEPVPFANIIVVGTTPLIGTTSDLDGSFILKDLPVGRHTVKVSMIGYESYLANELMVSAGKKPYVSVKLMPIDTKLDDVVVRIRKDSPLNSMSMLSSRQFTVEETRRYAGGLNDPARLASCFAGVATPSVSSNGISVRGNSPDGLLWLIEGVEVPNPNHFANLTVAGGGLFTAISSQMMGNSDFYTGAFPAQYGNASSGVFDIKLRNGNSQERHYTFQTGLLGVDFSTEGPFKRGAKASYLMNYRYSTMALLAPLLPDNTGVLKYQDLSFKLNFPTKLGNFTLWGICAFDGQDMDAMKRVEWEMDSDRDNSNTRLFMFGTGLEHNIRLGSKTFLNSKLSATGSGLSHEEKRLGYDLIEHPQSYANSSLIRYSVESDLFHNFGDRHANRTGFKYSHLLNRIYVEKAFDMGQTPVPLADGDENAGLLNFYTQSKLSLLPKFTMNIGIHSQWFMLNGKYSVEPRIGLKYLINERQSLALGYGLHSRIEQLSVYFVEKSGETPNMNLDLMNSTHYILSYRLKINEFMRLIVEPYYQHLTDVPVSPNNYISTINFEEEIFFDETLVSRGTGRNIGVDFTLERFLDKGYYYLFTTSLFDSKYTGSDGMQRNTRFNKNYVINALAGKEWFIGKDKNKLFSANIRVNYLGGNRKEPIDRLESLAAKDIVYAETEGNIAFDRQSDDNTIVSFTLSFSKNKSNHTSVWSLQILNALGAEEFEDDYYNLKKHSIDEKFKGIMVPNLSYRVEF